ncbi:hypothetical protein KJ671_01070 [Patescibacteria group bacterium]|nr:hypothetical protein [Patescibacteria group bacterium]
MNKYVYLSISIIGLFFFSCNNDSNYDKGYEDAWEGNEAPSSFWNSKEEKEGYEEGLEDAYTYDEGYNDGVDGLRPKYLNDLLYIEGYNDGKKDK